MIVSTTIHGLFTFDRSLAKSHLTQAQELLISTRKDGWSTKHTIEFLENDESEHELESLEDLVEFTSTDWDFINGSIITRPDSMDTPTAHNSYDKQLTLEHHEGPVEDSHTLSYLEGDILGLIPHPHNHNTPSIQPPLDIHKDTPASLVACYMHPSMPRFYPKSLLNPTGALNSSSPPPNLSSSAYEIATAIEPPRWLHMRMAWVVPVRGKASWPETSEGRLLADDNERAKSPYAQSKSYTQPIMWTPGLLNGFWKHLIRHRKRNTLGPLAFAFVPATEEGGLPDMIKVWCDSKMAMKVRTLLSVFCVEPLEEVRESQHRATEQVTTGACVEEKGVRNARTKAEELTMREDRLIAPLRRCRLVLLDDTGEPLLIS